MSASRKRGSHTPADDRTEVLAHPQGIDSAELDEEGQGSIQEKDFRDGEDLTWFQKIFRRKPHRRSDPTREQLENLRFQSDTRNRNVYAGVLLVILFLQLVVTHVMLFMSAFGAHDPAEAGFYLSDKVLIAYLGSVVVEVIGLVYGIVRGIFPLPDR